MGEARVPKINPSERAEQPRFDQTSTPLCEAAIEIILKSFDPAERDVSQTRSALPAASPYVSPRR